MISLCVCMVGRGVQVPAEARRELDSLEVELQMVVSPPGENWELSPGSSARGNLFSPHIAKGRKDLERIILELK